MTLQSNAKDILIRKTKSVVIEDAGSAPSSPSIPSLSRSYREISSFTLRTVVLTKFSRRRYFPFILFLRYFIPSSVANDRNPSSRRHKAPQTYKRKCKRLALTFFLASTCNGLLRIHFEPYFRSMAHKLVFVDHKLGNTLTSLNTTVLFMCVYTRVCVCVCIYMYMYIYKTGNWNIPHIVKNY